MNKRDLSERDICTKFITAALKRVGWDVMSQIREEVTFTKGRIIVRGRLVTRGRAKRPRDRFAAAHHHRLNNPEAATADASANGDIRPQSFRRKDTFDHLTTRPHDIKPPRQTILNLAVRSKPVHQDPNEESASELLNRIQPEKERLVREGKIRKAKPLSPVSFEEVPIEIAERWRLARMTQTSNTPSKYKPEDFSNFIIKRPDFTLRRIRYGEEGISREGLSFARLIPGGPILIACTGSAIGKASVTIRYVCCNQLIHSLTSYRSGPAQYCLIVLKPINFQNSICAVAGTGILPVIHNGKWELL